MRNLMNLPLKAVATSRVEFVAIETSLFPWETDDPLSAGSGRRCSNSEATSPLPVADGAYTAPISPETREHATERVGTQRDESPMDTRVSVIAGDRAGSLGMGFRGLAAKLSRLEAVDREGMRETSESTVDAVSTREAASRLGRAHRYLPVTHAGDEYSVGPWSANGGQLAIAAPAWHGRSLGLRT
ncbi:MAG: hypothetical protein ACC654_10225, partial [Acidimicrobiia bacterium]